MTKQRPQSVRCVQSGFLSGVPYLVLWLTQMSSGMVADFLRGRGYLTTTTTRKIFNTVGESICHEINPTINTHIKTHEVKNERFFFLFFFFPPAKHISVGRLFSKHRRHGGLVVKASAS